MDWDVLKVRFDDNFNTPSSSAPGNIAEINIELIYIL